MLSLNIKGNILSSNFIIIVKTSHTQNFQAFLYSPRESASKHPVNNANCRVSNCMSAA